MSAKEFSAILTDTTETDLVQISAREGFILGQIYINLNDNSGANGGFFSVNNVSDTLTLKFYVKDNAGNYQVVDAIDIAGDNRIKMPLIGDDQDLERDIKITATLDNFVANVDITGHYQERFLTAGGKVDADRDMAF